MMMAFGKLRYPVFAAALMLAAGAASAGAKPQRAPAFALKDVSGKVVRLADFKGKVVVLDFWATWCAPCRAEIPSFIALEKKYASRGLVVIGVALDDEGVAVVAPFASKMGMYYPVLIGTREVAQIYGGVEAIPTTFVIDRNGNIAAGHEGLTDEATIESEIKPLL